MGENDDASGVDFKPQTEEERENDGHVSERSGGGEVQEESQHQLQSRPQEIGGAQTQEEATAPDAENQSATDGNIDTHSGAPQNQPLDSDPKMEEESGAKLPKMSQQRLTSPTGDEERLESSAKQDSSPASPHHSPVEKKEQSTPAAEGTATRAKRPSPTTTPAAEPAELAATEPADGEEPKTEAEVEQKEETEEPEDAQEEQESSDHEIVVPDGEGEPLGRIPTVATGLRKATSRSSAVRCLHEMLYDDPGAGEERIELIKAWRGLAKDSDHAAFTAQLMACRVVEFYDISERIFGICLPKGLTKQILVTFFFELLAKPSKSSFGAKPLLDTATKREERFLAGAYWHSAGLTRTSTVQERVHALHQWVLLDDSAKEELAARKSTTRRAKRRKVDEDEEVEEPQPSTEESEE